MDRCDGYETGLVRYGQARNKKRGVMMGWVQVAVLVLLMVSALGGLVFERPKEPFRGFWNLLDVLLVLGLLWVGGFFGGGV